VAYLAYPGAVTYHDGGLNNSLDYSAYFGVNALFTLKSYTLFSLMFGVGFAYQIQSAARRKIPLRGRYLRRLIGLFILGVLHVTFAFVYAFKNKPVKSLLRWGIALLILQVLIVLLATAALYLGETFAPEDMAKAAAQSQAGLPEYYRVYGSGSLPEIMAFRWKDWVGYLVVAGTMQIPGVLAYFLLGFAIVKSGIISNPAAPIWSKARRIALPIGIAISPRQKVSSRVSSRAAAPQR